MDNEKIDSLIKKLLSDNPQRYIKNKINEIIDKKAIKISQLIQEVPKKSGVYLIYEKEFKPETFIYIGECDDLVRRLKGDISRGKKRYHTFLRKIGENKTEKQIKEIIEKDYLFSYIETESKEMAFIIEGILIRIYHSQLWNKSKKYQK